MATDVTVEGGKVVSSQSWRCAYCGKRGDPVGPLVYRRKDGVVGSSPDICEHCSDEAVWKLQCMEFVMLPESKWQGRW